MNDTEVIESFVTGGAVRAFGPRLHVDGDCLAVGGWWAAAYRVGPRTFALRQEEPPEETTAVEEVAAALGAAGLAEVPANLSLLVAITYTTIDMGLAEWSIWSTDAATADAELSARAGAESFFGDPAGPGMGGSDFSAGMGGLRRTAGLAPLVVLAVGIDAGAAAALGGALGHCHVEVLSLAEATPEVCESLTPALVLVDATSHEGELFALAMGARVAGHPGSGGRVLPVVALSPAAAAGADLTIDPGEDPARWADHLRAILP
ncbi:MAG: hypothetical protein ACRDY0_02280 [Acidimicrobiales bacterium]